MKTKTAIILSIHFSLVLFCATALYPHVVDLEYISPVDRYDLDPNKEGRDFFEWVNEQNRREDALHEWVVDLAKEVAFEVAASFDPRMGGERD